MIAMPGFQRPDAPSMHEASLAGAARPRRILCCLLGGPTQRATTEVAFDLARGTGARLTGLSGAGLQPLAWRGPLPVGGAFWAEWLAARSRQRLRQDCAASLDEFQAAAACAPEVEAVARHEEAAGEPLTRLLAGHDLAVLPAGIGPNGTPCEPGAEVTASLARTRLLPVLRVRRRPLDVRSLVLLVGASPACGVGAAGLLRSGLWPAAAVSVLPVADYRPGVAAGVTEQVDLLRRHGRKVTVLPSIELEFEAEELRRMLAHHQAAVVSCLSGRHGGFLDGVRNCAFETAAETVPLLLLP